MFISCVIIWVSVTVTSAMHLRTVTGRATEAASTVVQWLSYKVITYSMLSLDVQDDDEMMQLQESPYPWFFCSDIYIFVRSVFYLTCRGNGSVDFAEIWRV